MTEGDRPITQSKRCRDCGELKSLDAFPRSRRRPDGRGTYCKPCYAARYRQYRERKAADEGRTIRERRHVPAGMRYCPTCKQIKELENFPRNRSARGGHGGYCKPCHNKKTRDTYTRLYGGTREYHLRRRYGVTSADVDAMIASQGGTCATCDGKPEHVDHDHASGKVRGVLCFN
ncbi:MAG: hypothetical protein JO079_07060, partial [Frankiaceae bacterium]|nr:hypothetical protein [Frankiaceae bacterium]